METTLATQPATTPPAADPRLMEIARGVATAHPIVAARGEGAYLWDKDGRRYVDLVGGIGVMNVGHCHPGVVAAATAQLSKLTHTAYQVAAYDCYLELATRLNRLVGRGRHYKSVFLTTGAEAVENAVKVARAYTRRSGIVAFSGGFHGRTLMGMSLTGMSQPYKQTFGPFAPDTYHVPFPDAFHGVTEQDCLQAIDNLLAVDIAADRVAAFIIEPVQGDGGFRIAPPAFMQALRALCDRHGILLICDEIQTGFGRTGTMFGFEHTGVQPDIVTVAKSLAGGLPLSGVVGRAEVMDAPLPGGLGGTYGGNPVACAAALAVLDAFENDHLLARAQAIGKQVRQGFDTLAARHRVIGEVRGIGAMLALEIVHPASGAPDAETTQRVLDLAREEGVLAIKCGVNRNVVRCLLPLVADEAAVQEALEGFGRAFARL